MPPKTISSDSKAMLQSPKIESYAAAVGGASTRMATRSNRRPSNEGLESIASDADLARYDANGVHNSGIIGSSNRSSITPSMTSPPIMLSDDESKQLQALIAKATGKLAANVVASSAAHAPSTIMPRTHQPSVGSNLNGGSGANSSVDPSLHRLLTGVSLGAGMPMLPTGHRGIPMVPGGVATGEHIDEAYLECDGEEEEQEKPPKPSANDLKWNHITVAERNRWAPGSVTGMRAHYQSFQARAIVCRCKDIRNKHEVDSLSAILDATLAGRSDVVLEIAIRRIVGIEEADASGGRDWDVASALDIAKPGALGNDELRRQLRKDAAQIKANRSKSGQSTSSSSRTSPGTGGSWSKSGNYKKKNKGSGGSGARQGGSGNTTTMR